MFAQKKLLIFFITLSVILSFSFTINGVIAQGNPFAHDSAEIFGIVDGFEDLDKTTMDKLTRPANANCADANGCINSISADGTLNCVGAGSNIFGAGKCTFEEKEEKYECDSSGGDSAVCTKKWVEWICTHTTAPNSGCQGSMFSTKDGAMENMAALNAARDSASAACCSGCEGKAIGPSAGKGTHYKGYFCRC